MTATWISNPKGCGKCNSCGMDMDMSPYCVQASVLADAEKKYGKDFPYGLNINDARIICEGDLWTPREVVTDE